MVLYITNCVLIMIKTAKGSNPRRFIIFPKNGEDLCAHRAGGASTYKFCASPFLKEFCMARLRFLDLPPLVNEATEFQTSTKRGYGSASVAVRAEKRANKNVII